MLFRSFDFVSAACPKQSKQRSFCSSPPASFTWGDHSLDFVMVQYINGDKINSEDIPKEGELVFIVIFNTESNKRLYYKEEKRQV